MGVRGRVQYRCFYPRSSAPGEAKGPGSGCDLVLFLGSIAVRLKNDVCLSLADDVRCAKVVRTFDVFR